MNILSEILYFIIYHLVRYRRKVTRTNLANAYPQRTVEERRKIEHAYYHHICDLLLEGIYNLYASPQSIMKRYHFVNRQVLNQYYEKGQSIILMSAHYNNWEYMITSLDQRISHHGIGVGKPLDNKSFGRFITARRARYGTEIVDQTDVRQAMAYYDKWHIPVAYMMLSDQSPSNPHKSLWTSFFGQDTAFLFGAEHFARKYNMPVFFYDVAKVRRGRYNVRFQLLTEHPNELPEGDITRRYAQHLEQVIREAPQYWLWSHRRWKLTHEGKILKDGTLKIINNGRKTDASSDTNHEK